MHYELRADFPFHSRFGISAVKIIIEKSTRIIVGLSFAHLSFGCWEGNNVYVKPISMTYYWYPPTYYNGFIEHPILWSDNRRRWEEQRLAHECYSVWKTQERIKQSEKLRNQSEVWKPNKSRALNRKRQARKSLKYILVIFYVSTHFITLRTIKQSSDSFLILTLSSSSLSKVRGTSKSFLFHFFDNTNTHSLGYTIRSDPTGSMVFLLRKFLTLWKYFCS